MRQLTGRITVALLIGAGLLTTAGCGSVIAPAAGTPSPQGTSVGGLVIRDTVLVRSIDDRSVGLVVTLINPSRADVLSSVTVQAGRTVVGGSGPPVTLTARPNLNLPAGGVVRLGGPGEPQVVLADPNHQLRAGVVAQVSLAFAGAGDGLVYALVQEPVGYLRPYAPM